MTQLPDESRTNCDALEVALLAMVRSEPRGWEVLLTRRAAEVHLGGYWELPGGEVESDASQPGRRSESPRLAACREASEKLGLTIKPEQLFACGSTSHAYPDRTILFHVFVLPLLDEAGVDVRPIKRVHAWVRVNQLDVWHLPPANTAISQLLRKRLAEMQRRKGL